MKRYSLFLVKLDFDHGIYVATSPDAALRGFVDQHNRSCDSTLTVRQFRSVYPGVRVTRYADDEIVIIGGDYQDEVFEKTAKKWVKESLGHIRRESWMLRSLLVNGYNQLDCSYLVK